MNAPRTADRLAADDDDGEGGGHDPKGKVGADVAHRIINPECLYGGRDKWQHSARGERRRAIAAKLRAARHLAADRRNICQCLVEVLHVPILYFAIQSILKREKM